MKTQIAECPFRSEIAGSKQQGGKKESTGRRLNQHWPAVRQAILELIAQPPQKCPHCRKRAAA
jgi:hypothetical protein